MKMRKRKSHNKTHVFGQPFTREDMGTYKLDRKERALLREGCRKSKRHKLFYRGKAVFKFFVVKVPMRTISPLLEKKIPIPGGHDDPQFATILSDRKQNENAPAQES